jgi:hypothetical protein
LRDQHDALVTLHGQVERMDGFFPADKQRDHHVGINHHIAQRQYRHCAWLGQIIELGFVLLHGGASAVEPGKLGWTAAPARRIE